MATHIFTTEEEQVLLAMINIAVKTEGMNAAEAGVVLTKKINANIAAAASPPAPPADIPA